MVRRCLDSMVGIRLFQEAASKGEVGREERGVIFIANTVIQHLLCDMPDASFKNPFTMFNALLSDQETDTTLNHLL